MINGMKKVIVFPEDGEKFIKVSSYYLLKGGCGCSSYLLGELGVNPQLLSLHSDRKKEEAV
jgi:hypothetical protein